MQPVPEQAPIFVRVHTRVIDAKARPEYGSNLPDKWANFALVFDCETTVDLRQDLTFLWWRFCELKNGVYVCQREGIAHNDGVSKESVGLIRDFARKKRANVETGCPTDILVQSRTAFVDGTFWDALSSGAFIVCFNAPFDLSRLALEYREARNKGTGWSMVMWKYEGDPDKRKPRPNLRIKPKDSRSAFISLAGGEPDNRVEYRGRFLDLSVLGWSLRNRHMTLEGFLKSFGLKGKMKHEPNGLVTRKELEYGRRDVERTVALLNAMKWEYDGFPIALQPERAMSAASITKAFLNEMEIKQPANKFNLPDDILGKCMQAYYGGRSEIRIRHEEVPVVVCDTTSEYPSVAVLLKLWALLIAADVRVEKCTAEAHQTLDSVDVKTLLEPVTWQKLAFFAAIKPAGDILPVRSLHGVTENTTIGLNPLTCEEPIWYSGPDLAASKLLTGAPPQITEAFKLLPQGIQERMRVTSIGERRFDPSESDNDFFRAIIEERKKLPKKHPHYLLLKIVANSLYGIFAELNKEEYGKHRAKRLGVFSGSHVSKETTCVVEKPGLWQFPPAAALITAGGRLMLTMLERMADERQGTYLLTDTDSMLFVASQRGGLVACTGGPQKMADGTPAVRAMTWNQVKEICHQLNSLNPYDRSTVGQILKIEDCNKDRQGHQHQLYGLAISAKRYVVYTRHQSRRKIIKPSEHGLGMVYVPDERKRYRPVDCEDQETNCPRWIVEAWERLLDDHFRTTKDPENTLVAQELWFGNLPAMMRIRVTTPNVLKALRKRDPGAAKPYNFALSPILTQARQNVTLVAPFSKHSKDWLTRDYTETHSGDQVHLLGEYRGNKLLPQTLSGVLWRHYLHPEEKSLGPGGERCDGLTRGLLGRRPLKALIPFNLIGKEVERKAQEGEDLSLLKSMGPIRYHAGQRAKTRAADPGLVLRANSFGVRPLMRESGASQHSVQRFLAGDPVHPTTRVRLAEAVERLERERGV